MSSVSQQIQDLKGRFSGLNKRMQRLVLSGVLALVYALIDMAVVQPLMDEYSEVTKAIEKTRLESKTYAAQLLNLKNDIGIDPSMTEEQQSAILIEKLNELDVRIARATTKFVAPEQMTEFIYEALVRSRNLKMVTMEKLPLETVVIRIAKEETEEERKNREEREKLEPAKSEIKKASSWSMSEDKFYKHSIELVLEGKYLDIVNYLKNLEAMPWRVFWQRTELESNYPVSRIRLTLYTLSLDSHWMTL